ncbi:MAG: bis(5'-nucleosyl)-tetraphosphatase (symmetrical) YqeK [Clostridia bacterium]|nr:bis(5'-nucleosyl)-tetraphosphatase (symmetrical) YqeK [Clostridia bacterium]
MFDPKELDNLLETVGNRMSPKRFAHTRAVADMAVRMADLYCPEEADKLYIAGLLHDLTKELTAEQQFELCEELGVPYDPFRDALMPKTLHAKTAAALIGRDFPEYADPVIVSAVRWHTTGHEKMTITERILYLADYIDETRKFEDCVILREMFWGADPLSMDPEQRYSHLRKVMIRSFDMTIRSLLEDQIPISPDTIAARNDLLFEREEYEKRKNQNA